MRLPSSSPSDLLNQPLTVKERWRQLTEIRVISTSKGKIFLLPLIAAVLEGCGGGGSGSGGEPDITLRAEEEKTTGGKGNDKIVVLGRNHPDSVIYWKYTAKSIEEDIGEEMAVTLSDIENSQVDDAAPVPGHVDEIDGDEGVDELIVYGTSDLSDVVISNIEQLSLNGDVTLDPTQLGNGGITHIIGDDNDGAGVPTLRLEGDGELRLSELTLENVRVIEVGAGVTVIVQNADELAGVEQLLGAGHVVVESSATDVFTDISVDPGLSVGNPTSASVSATSLGGADLGLPTDIIPSAITSVAEGTSSARVKVADIQVTIGGSDIPATDAHGLALAGEDARFFELDGAELYLRAGVELDHEMNDQLEVTVYSIANHDVNEEITVQVSDVNEAPATSGDLVLSVSEGGMSTLSVDDFSAEDEDAGDTAADLTWRVTTAPTGGRIALGSAPGTAITSFTQAQLAAGQVVYVHGGGETPTDSFAVQVEDDEIAPLKAPVQTVAVTVTEEDDAPTAVSLTGTTISLAETDASERVKVADIEVTDDDGRAPSDLLLRGDDAALFEMNAAQTELYLRAGVSLDFETNPDLDVTVQAVAATGVSDSLSIALTNVNEAPSVSVLSFNVTENAADSATVGTAATATDPDSGDTLTYSITGGSGENLFAIGSANGRITVDTAGAGLDHETGGVHTLTVTVTDAGGLSDSETITVTVTDINEAPTTSGDTALTVIEGEMYTLTTADFSAEDVDAGDTAADLTWRVTTAPTGGRIALGSAPGTAITSFTQAQLAAGQVVYVHGGGETPTDRFVVQVEDDETAPLKAPAQTVSVTVTPVDDAPTAISLTGTTTSLAENTDTATRVKVADIAVTDVDGRVLPDLILLGADAALFEMNDQQTELYLRAGAEVDFETNPSLDVTVRAVSAISVSADLSITVTDVNEAPSAPTLDRAVIPAGTDTSTGAYTVGVLSSTDPESSAITYTIVSAFLGSANAANVFQISSDGNLQIRQSATLADAGEEYEVTVRATTGDGGPASEATLTVRVGGAEFESSTAAINENDGVARTFDIAFDGLTDAKITAASGAPGTVVRVDDNTIRVTGPYDHETLDELEITLTIEHGEVGDRQEFDQVLLLPVTDVNEAPSISTQTLTVDEGQTAVGTVSGATDPDDGDSLTYSITGGNTGDIFVINGTTGAITVAGGQTLDYETATSYTLTVTVTDTDGLTNNAEVTVQVADVNEAPTTSGDTALTVTEGGMYTLTTADFSAEDVDAGDTAADLTWRVTTAPTGGRIALGSAPGTAITSFTQAQLAAGQVVYVHGGGETATDSFAVQVEDDETAPLKAPAQTVSVTVTAVDDVPTGISLTGTTTSLAEDADTSGQTKVANIAVTDVDGRGTASVLELVGADAALFEMNAGQTELYLRAGAEVDFETNPSLDVSVRAVSATSVSADLSITVTDVNEAPSAPTLDDTVIPVGTDTSTGAFTVGVLSSTDPESGTISYTLVSATLNSADATNVFQISGSNLQVRQSATLAAAGEEYEVTVRATTGDGGPASETTLTVRVGGAEFESSTAAINENDGTARTFDIAFDGLTNAKITAATGAAGTVVRVDDNTIRVTGPYDHETLDELEITLTIEHGEVGDRQEFDQVLLLPVADVNEAPSISAQTLTVDEGQTAVGTVSGATDPDDGDSLTYSITGGNTGDTFVINGTTGAITVAGGKALDYETATSYTLTVTVTDTGGATSNAEVTVRVADVNDAPTTSGDTALTVTEGGMYTLTTADFSAEDEDAGDTAADLTWRVTTAPTGGRIALGSAPGTAITSFTQTQLAAGQVVYVHGGGETATDSFAVQVEDDETAPLKAPAQTVSVTVTPVDDTPTGISLTGTTTSLVDNVDTTTRVKVADIVVTDVDGRGTASVLELVGTDAALFEMNAGQTELYLRAGADVDFETNPNLDVTVRAVSSTGVLADLSITVGGAKFDSSTAAINENDGTARTFDIAFEGLTNARITAATGAAGTVVRVDDDTIRVTGPYDHETLDELEITLTIEHGAVGDRQTFNQVLLLPVTDVNEAPSISALTLTVDEDQTAVGTVSGATDPDDGDSLTYSITGGNTGDTFVINGATGAITVAGGKALDYETATSYTLTVTVTDTGGATSNAEVTVQVADVNEAPGSIALNSDWIGDTDTTNPIEIGTLSAEDPEGDTVSYTLVSAFLSSTDVTSAFEIVNGVLRLKQGETVAATGSEYTITVRATDDGTPGMSADGVVTVTVLEPQYGDGGTTALGTSPNQDTLTGTSGRDYLVGGRYGDTLLGGAGDDVLDGGVDDDKLTGGAGADVFIIRLDSSAANLAGEGEDTITDFTAGEDKIYFQDASGTPLTLAEFERWYNTEAGYFTVSVDGDANEGASTVTGGNRIVMDIVGNYAGSGQGVGSNGLHDLYIETSETISTSLYTGGEFNDFDAFIQALGGAENLIFG